MSSTGTWQLISKPRTLKLHLSVAQQLTDFGACEGKETVSAVYYKVTYYDMIFTLT